MMPSPLSYSAACTALPTQYAIPDPIHDSWVRQITASQLVRRFSRGSNGQRSGTTMRVTKPTSASNSPRSVGRRRTMVNDGNFAWRKQQVMDQVVLPAPGVVDLASEPVKQRTPRPVSWHPASSHFQLQAPQAQQQYHQVQQRQPTTTYYFPTQDLSTSYQHMSPMLSSYSCQTSPVTFSPLSLPASDIAVQPCLPVDNQAWGYAQEQPSSYVSPPMEACSISPALDNTMDYQETFPPLFTNPTSSTILGGNDGSQPSDASEWRSFVEHGFDRTSPPTPENLPQVQHVKTAVKSEETAPYEPLQESDDEGEILVGMGLYDTPEKYEADPGLNNYRSTLSSLLGGGAPKLCESSGKGLKLEETWQPPESDDEEEEDDDEKEKSED
ncbi:hypothetical protein jhhlp_008625 [Lomentospora prolificans]|uniref:Uncharacterized protein n=1 Tax=Lomentospora prolificans TaxID=41688 RepID=A0A2N3MYJ5_9PEZI|nr:hypothetical protein jhhlp_008625 [Lomentospora prolificans]